jgi:excisionase family DNA binding protein
MSLQPRPCKACGAPTLRLAQYCDGCEYMTHREAARRLRVSEATYFRIIRSGAIKRRKIGRRHMVVSRAEVDNLLAGSAEVTK